MSLLLKAGISRLSELEIDADKDWQTKGISNIKEIVLGMAIGDVVQHNGTRLVKLSPGQAHHVLTSEGPGKLVVWAPGGTYFFRYFPVTVYLTHSGAKVSPDKSHSKSISMSSWNRQAYEDAPADYIKRLTPSIALADAEAVVTPNKTGDKSAPVATAIVFKKVLPGQCPGTHPRSSNVQPQQVPRPTEAEVVSIIDRWGCRQQCHIIGRWVLCRRCFIGLNASIIGDYPLDELLQDQCRGYRC